MAVTNKQPVKQNKPGIQPKGMKQDPMKWVNPDTGEVMVISYSQQLQRERLMLDRARLREDVRKRKLQTAGLIIIVLTLIFLMYIFYRLDQLDAVMSFLLK